MFLLPLVPAYNLVDLSAQDKETLCQQNSLHCSQSCLFSAENNVCDKDSLKFTCSCQQPEIRPVVHLFPIQIRQCFGDINECQSDCVGDYPTFWAIEECSSRCVLNYSCGTPYSQEDIDYLEDSEVVDSQPNSTFSSTAESTEIVEPTGTTVLDTTEVAVPSITGITGTTDTIAVPTGTTVPINDSVTASSTIDVSSSDSVEQSTTTMPPMTSPVTSVPSSAGAAVTTVVVNVNAPEGPSEINYVPVSAATSLVYIKGRDLLFSYVVANLFLHYVI